MPQLGHIIGLVGGEGALRGSSTSCRPHVIQYLYRESFELPHFGHIVPAALLSVGSFILHHFMLSSFLSI